MKICIVGTGAMGSVYAGLLAAAGNEVWAVDRWADHIAAIRKNGLKIDGKSGDRTVPLNATMDTAEVGFCDQVIIATKAMDVAQAAESTQALLGQDTDVLTIQNGLGSAEKVVGILGTKRVIVGIAGGFGASIKAPGHVHHCGMEFVHLGELKGPATPRLEKVAIVWRDAGFNVTTYDDVDQLIWEKLICNVCYSGTCTLTEMTIGEVLKDDNAWRVASGCAAEAFHVARAHGVIIGFDDPIDFVHNFGARIPDARPSMLLDHLADRPSEIDVINGAIPVQGKKCGVPTPFNTAVSALVRAKEARLGLR
ncbi:MAG: 2-dehydropantoate 2-reductase [Desulfobacterales bacterium]|jgi:2-dehydropantoate 2-reductase